jgi:formimidoylglutamate deiminase
VASHGNGPIHIHVAEQVKEVDDCIAWSGARPVEWLLANAPVDQRWCFIHATHMTEAETAEMAIRGAIAGLCPITEANLGDGIFPAETFLKNRGQFGIGSDSNISISVAHELRQLEYSERLGLRARNVVAEAGQSTGRRLFDGALAGGANALSGGAGLSAGSPADFVSLDAEDVFVRSDDQLLDHWIFADGVKVGDVWTNGRKCVENGRHVARARIVEQFRKTMKNLVNR